MSPPHSFDSNQGSGRLPEGRRDEFVVSSEVNEPLDVIPPEQSNMLDALAAEILGQGTKEKPHQIEVAEENGAKTEPSPITSEVSDADRAVIDGLMNDISIPGMRQQSVDPKTPTAPPSTESEPLPRADETRDVRSRGFKGIWEAGDPEGTFPFDEKDFSKRSERAAPQPTKAEQEAETILNAALAKTEQELFDGVSDDVVPKQLRNTIVPARLAYLSTSYNHARNPKDVAAGAARIRARQEYAKALQKLREGFGGRVSQETLQTREAFAQEFERRDYKSLLSITDIVQGREPRIPKYVSEPLQDSHVEQEQEFYHRPGAYESSPHPTSFRVRVAERNSVAGEYLLRVVSEIGGIEYLVEASNPEKYKSGDRYMLEWTGIRFGPRGVHHIGALEPLGADPKANKKEEAPPPAAETKPKPPPEPLVPDGEQKRASQPESSVERAVSAEILEPRFIVGVVEEEVTSGDNSELFVRVDRDGYDRRVLPFIPERVRVSANVAPGQVIVMRAENIQGETQWIFHKRCGLGEHRAEIEALAYRSGVDPDFSEATEQQVSILREAYEKEGDRKFMEREAITFIDNDGKEHRGELIKELAEYRHGETRLDLRDRDDIDIFTIDPENAKDFDDAISYREVERDGKKVYEIGVHIADVAHFARLGTALEQDARLRQFTRYLKQMTATMLPEFISNTLCSLAPGEDRLAFSTIFTFNEDGTLTGDPWIGRSIIRSKERHTYDSADALLGVANDARGMRLRKIQEFTAKMREGRKDRGAIAFDQRPEANIEFGSDSRATAIYPKERRETSLLIEDLSLAANEAQAKFLVDPSGGESLLLLRAHEQPELSRVIELSERVMGWDPENPANAELVEAQERYQEARAIRSKGQRENALRALSEGDLIPKLVNNMRAREKTGNPKFREVIRVRMMRLLGSAEYTTDQEEHFSLAVEPYLHATSPIRRYPDLIVQYLVDEKLRRRQGVSTVNTVSLEFLNEIADRANIARYQARRAEQDVIEHAFLDLIETSGKGARYTGQNAIVIGASERGVRVAVTVQGGYRHPVLIPWSHFNNVEEVNGRHVYRYRQSKGGEWVTVSALKHFGPSKQGYRSLELRTRSIDRVNRTVEFSVRSGRRLQGSEEGASGQGGEERAEGQRRQGEKKRRPPQRRKKTPPKGGARK